VASIHAGLRQIGLELKKFIEDGKSSHPFELSGTASFMYRNQEYNARIWMEKQESEYFLMMDKEDIKKLCEAMDETVWEEEIEVVSKYVLRIPRLINIRDHAKKRAKEIYLEDKRVLEKPYRHILWSYLLTKAYGEEFAEALTNAHEARSDKEDIVDNQNEEAEESHKMDMNNNKAGRSYAKMGYAEKSIPSILLHDHQVIMAPGLQPGERAEQP
jgi:hypothetical protein